MSDKFRLRQGPYGRSESIEAPLEYDLSHRPVFDSHNSRRRLEKALPSIRRTIAEAIFDIRQSNSPHRTNRTSKGSASKPQKILKEYSANSQNPETRGRVMNSRSSRSSGSQEEVTSEYLRATRPSNIAPTQNQPFTNPQYRPWQMPAAPALPSSMNRLHNNAAQAVPQSSEGPKPMIFYAEPHPRMYPYVPSEFQALPARPSMQQVGGMPSTEQQLMYRSHGSRTRMTATMGTDPADFNRIAPKCKICGHTRSPHYQWKHPVVPGQIPRPSICRRCRKQETDSESDGMTLNDKRGGRRKWRTCHDSEASSLTSEQRPRFSTRKRYQTKDIDCLAYNSRVGDSSSDEQRGRDSRRQGSRDRESSSTDADFVRRSKPLSRPKDQTTKVSFAESLDSDEDGSASSDVDTEFKPRQFVRKSTKSARPYISRDQFWNSSTSTPAEVKPKVFAEPEWGPASSSKEQSHTPDWFYPSRWKPTSERRRQSSTRYDGGEDERTSLADSDQPLCDPAQGRPERTENAANITGQPNKKPVKAPKVGRVEPPVCYIRALLNQEAWAAMNARQLEVSDDEDASTAQKHQNQEAEDAETPQPRRELREYDWYDKNGMRIRVREI